VSAGPSSSCGGAVPLPRLPGVRAVGRPPRTPDRSLRPTAWPAPAARRLHPPAHGRTECL